MDFGGEKVTIIYPGPTQAPDKLAVYFPQRKLLYGSCMVIGMNETGNMGEADLTNWPVAVKKLMQYPVVMVVPEHGEKLDPEILQKTIDLLETKK